MRLDTPPILDGAAALLSQYEAIFCDVWGVLHNGARAYPAAGDALSRYRSEGGRVVLVSNAPLPSHSVAALLDHRHVRRDAWDTIVSSGDLARAHIVEHGYERLHHIGPDRDLGIFADTKVRLVALEEAQAIACTGLIDDERETGESYRPLLLAARERNLPLICANPDLVVDVGGTLLPCAGIVATMYEAMGGSVYWAGKPYAIAYQSAHRRAEDLLQRPVDRSRILAIGDAIRTDVAGAVNYGVDVLFISHGIHRDELMPAGSLDRDELARFLAAAAHKPKAIMAELAW